MVDITKAFAGTTFKRYQVQERLGSGGMARVFKGHDRNLDRTVAIKVLHEHLADDATFKERFEREARLVASLNHPNIVQVFDYDSIEMEGQHLYYMVMSYVGGPTLRDVLAESAEKGERLSSERVLKLMLNLTDALGYAHQRGMIHRDVKPANILLNERDEAVLTDFGIARMAQGGGLTQEGITVGTPAYMSPEQATGDAVDARSDLYALGVILFELLTGTPPFGDDGSVSVLLKHLTEPVPSLSQFHIDNPYLESIIFKALAKNREERYQTAQEMAADLKAAFAEKMSDFQKTPEFTRTLQPVSATPSQPTTQVVPAETHTTRAPLGLLGIGLVIIAALVLVGLLTQMDNSADAAQTNPETGAQAEVELADGMTGAFYFSSTFDEQDAYLDFWPQGDMEGLTRSVTPEGFYQIQSNLSAQAAATIFQEQGTYADVVIQMTAQLQPGSSGPSAYGIIFNHVDNRNYNVFAVDGLGRFSIWVRQDGVWRELRGADSEWTPTDAANGLGEMNTLTVSITGDQFTGMVNGETVTTVEDSTMAAGQIGIYVATPRNGSADVLIDQFQVMESLPELADSMTGDDVEPEEITPEATAD